MKKLGWEPRPCLDPVARSRAVMRLTIASRLSGDLHTDLPLCYEPPNRSFLDHSLLTPQQNQRTLWLARPVDRLPPLPGAAVHVHLLPPRARPHSFTLPAHPETNATTMPRARLALCLRQPDQCRLYCSFRCDLVPSRVSALRQRQRLGTGW